MSATKDLQGKTILITGATEGIGKAAAQELASRGADLFIVARDPAKGARVLAELKAASGSDRIELLIADLASLQSVRDLAAAFKAKRTRLDVLVNNAGAVFMNEGKTKDGHEQTFGVNHLAPFLLTNLLLDVLEASAPSRIVNVSSDAHRSGKIDFDDLDGTKGGYSGWRAYAQSKLANILFSKELAVRLKGTGVVANALHPGVVRTGFGMNTPGFVRFGLRLVRPFLLTPEQGASTIVYLATAPDAATVSGEYFAKSKVKRPNAAALDAATATRLWEVSEKLTGLRA